MDKVCLHCQQRLSFSKGVRGELFCSTDHRELYLQAETALAFERVACFDNPSSPERAEPNPAAAHVPVELVSISAAKPRGSIRIWMAAGIAACLAILVLGAIFLGPARRNAHSWLPHVSQSVSAAEQDPTTTSPTALAQVLVADSKVQSSLTDAVPSASPVISEDLTSTMHPAPSEPEIRHAAGIRVTQASWVAACSDGKEVLRRVLANGATREIEFSEKVIVRTGNAGGTELSVDGRLLGSLGPAGAVRIVELAPDGFHLLPPAPGNDGHDCQTN